MADIRAQMANILNDKTMPADAKHNLLKTIKT